MPNDRNIRRDLNAKADDHRIEKKRPSVQDIPIGTSRDFHIPGYGPHRVGNFDGKLYYIAYKDRLGSPSVEANEGG